MPGAWSASGNCWSSSMPSPLPEPGSRAGRVAAQDWAELAGQLDDHGHALTGPLLTPEECRSLAELYDRAELFRSTVDMARHRFGSGEYRYFTHDLPEPVRDLREALYPHLLVIARDWAG